MRLIVAVRCICKLRYTMPRRHSWTSLECMTKKGSQPSKGQIGMRHLRRGQVRKELMQMMHKREEDGDTSLEPLNRNKYTHKMGAIILSARTCHLPWKLGFAGKIYVGSTVLVRSEAIYSTGTLTHNSKPKGAHESTRWTHHISRREQQPRTAHCPEPHPPIPPLQTTRALHC